MTGKHDKIKDGEYEKRCYCEKCTKKYDEWCDQQKQEGCTIVKRKCFTICKYVAERQTIVTNKWGYKEKFDGKWEKVDKVDKDCKDCDKTQKSVKHDKIKNGEYEKRCYCEKCTKKYDEWCNQQKQEGCTIVKRKCYTICKYVAEKQTIITDKWGYKEKFEGKWEKVDKIDKPCKDCDKKKSRK